MSQGHPNSAILLLRRIKEKTLDPKELTKHNRRLCIRHLINEQPELSQAQIAHIVGTSTSSCSRYIGQINTQDKWIVERMDPWAWGVRLIRNAEIHITKLRQNGQWYLAHKVDMELNKELRELGILPKVATPIELKGTLEANITFKEIVKLAVGIHPNKGENTALGRTGGGLASFSPN